MRSLYKLEIILSKIRDFSVQFVDEFFIGLALTFLIIFFIIIVLPIGIIDQLLSGERLPSRYDFLQRR